MTTLIGTNKSGTYTSASLTDGHSHRLLSRTTDESGNIFVYVLASVSIAQYAMVIISQDGKCSQVTDTNARKPGMPAVSQVNLQDGEYGWVQVQGKGVVAVAASCQPNVALYTTGVSGVVDDATASTSQFQIIGLIASQSQTNAAGSVRCVMNNMNFQRGNPGATI